jgi:hypothetical protein
MTAFAGGLHVAGGNIFTVRGGAKDLSEKINFYLYEK